MFACWFKLFDKITAYDATFNPQILMLDSKSEFDIIFKFTLQIYECLYYQKFVYCAGMSRQP